jgi:molybdate transport system substrate-binding protein
MPGPHCRLVRFCLGLLLALGTGCGTRPAPEAKPVLVFAAASTIDVLESLQADAEKAAGAPVAFSFAASSRLAQQIAEGAPADLFLSADGQWASFLEQKGLTARRIDLLGNRLVIIVPVDSSATSLRPDDLTAGHFAKIAIADPSGVPAGVYAREALTRLGLWEKIQPKLIATDDVRAALVYCERGEVDAAIVYQTDAMSSGTVRLVCTLDVPPETPIHYPLVLLAASGKRPEAVALFEFLLSATARSSFERFGFVGLHHPQSATTPAPPATTP